MIQSTYVLLLIITIMMGLYCSHKLCSDNPLWVRLIVLSPALSSFISLWVLIGHPFKVIFIDCIQSGSLILIYAMVVAALAGKPLLRFRTKND